MDMINNYLHILQHALGLDKYGQGNSYRNYYVAGPSKILLCKELVSLGLMEEKLVAKELLGGDTCYKVTQTGIDYVKVNSPKAPKLTRSQKRYKEYLESDCNMSFAQWLGINQ